MQKDSRANQKRPLCPRTLGLALRGKLYSNRRSQVQPPRYSPLVSTQSWHQRWRADPTQTFGSVVSPLSPPCLPNLTPSSG